MLEVIATERAPKALGTYSQAVRCGELLFVSGQIGLEPKTGEFVAQDFKLQAHQAFENLKAIVHEAGAALENTVKLNISVVDMAEFHSFNTVMVQFFSEPYPARAVVGVAVLPKNALVEIEAIVSVAD